MVCFACINVETSGIFSNFDELFRLLKVLESQKVYFLDRITENQNLKLSTFIWWTEWKIHFIFKSYKHFSKTNKFSIILLIHWKIPWHQQSRGYRFLKNKFLRDNFVNNKTKSPKISILSRLIYNPKKKTIRKIKYRFIFRRYSTS